MRNKDNIISPIIFWNSEDIEPQRKAFIEKISTKLCNHYGVSRLVVPKELLNPILTRQDLLHEVLQLVLQQTKLKT